jgi:DNA modification methylase
MDDVKVLDQYATEHAALYHADCIEGIRGLPDNSVDLIVTSIPFSDQYTYSPSAHDMGNNTWANGHDEFFDHFDWLIPELFRVTVPGRLAVIHCKDRLIYNSAKEKYDSDGAGLYPFSDDVSAAMRRHRWVLHTRITIATDPVREMRATNRHGLLYKYIKQDASLSAGGIPEYLLVFRKWAGLHDDRMSSIKPVTHTEEDFSLRRWQLEANSAWQSDGLILPHPYNHEARVAAIEDGYDLENGQRVPYRGGKHAGPKIPNSEFVWGDISRMDTLNYQLAKEGNDEKHICPLQLDLIRRCVHRWTNPGEVVLDPFAGVGSVPYVAIQMGRKAVGFELKQSYFEWACKYVDDAEREKDAPQLF